MHFAAKNIDHILKNRFDQNRDPNRDVRRCTKQYAMARKDYSTAHKTYIKSAFFHKERARCQMVAICAGRRPQMRCSAAGLRSQRPPFRRAQRPLGDGFRQPLSHPSSCGFGSNQNGEVLRCPFQNGIGRNLVIQDHCAPALWVTLRADERAELHLATFL